MILCAQFYPHGEAGGAQVRVWASESRSPWLPDWVATSFRDVPAFEAALARAEAYPEWANGGMLCARLGTLMLGVPGRDWKEFVGELHKMALSVTTARAAYYGELPTYRLLNFSPN